MHFWPVYHLIRVYESANVERNISDVEMKIISFASFEHELKNTEVQKISPPKKKNRFSPPKLKPCIVKPVQEEKGAQKKSILTKSVCVMLQRDGRVPTYHGGAAGFLHPTNYNGGKGNEH